MLLLISSLPSFVFFWGGVVLFLIVTNWGNGSLGNRRSKRQKSLPSLSAVTDSLHTPVGGTKTFEIWDLINAKMFQWQNTLEGDTGTLTHLSMLPNCSFPYLHYDILLPCHWTKKTIEPSNYIGRLLIRRKANYFLTTNGCILRAVLQQNLSRISQKVKDKAFENWKESTYLTATRLLAFSSYN